METDTLRRGTLLLMLLLPCLLASNHFPLTDEQYYQLPPLFHLDQYGSCLSQPGGVYCLGTFDLSAGNHSLLFRTIKEFSSDTQNFNHSRLHRGLCLSARCGDATDRGPLPRQFEQCVASYTGSRYGLDATLSHLDYCKTATSNSSSRPIDSADLVFVAASALILLFNIIGTLYDAFRNADEKTNNYLMAWSVIDNWKRLTTTYKDGDERLSALKPLQGVKALSLILVIVAHTGYSNFMGYSSNPVFFEKHGRRPYFFIFYNGTLLVQIFFLISSFLMAYNLLLIVEKNRKITFKLTLLPLCLLQRLIRILPLYLFVLGLACTWWPRSYDGALWTPLVEAEASRCRHKFWAQALFVNNFYEPDERCLIQTWFLAVDIQLFIVASTLTLLLGRWRRTAVKIFGILFICSICGVFTISYYWNLKSMLFIMKPELIRKQLSYVKSFSYMYAAPWGSLSSSLMGLFLAFLHYNLEKTKFNASQYLMFKIAYWISVPMLFVWVFSGYWVRNVTSPIAVSLYTALDRPIFIMIVAVTFLGLIHFKDDLFRKFLSCRVFRILGRMSLAVLLLHWGFNLSIIGGRTLTNQTTTIEIFGDTLLVIFITYLASLPASLLIEIPVQKFFKNMIIKI